MFQFKGMGYFCCLLNKNNRNYLICLVLHVTAAVVPTRDAWSPQRGTSLSLKTTALHTIEFRGCIYVQI